MLELEARELGLAEYLDDETVKTVQRVFPGGSGRLGISRSSFREGGLPHRLLVLTDLTRPLREEERQKKSCRLGNASFACWGMN